MLKIIHCKIVSDLNNLCKGFATGKLSLYAHGGSCLKTVAAVFNPSH